MTIKGGRYPGLPGLLPVGVFLLALASTIIMGSGVAGGAEDNAKVPQSVEAAPRAGGRAMLTVTSSPAGAAIYLGDRPLGNTPWSGTDLPVGHLALHLRLQNYAPVDEAVDLVAGVENEKSYALIPDAGGMDIVTDPPGARIYLDGQAQEGKTPRTITDLALGSHRVKVHLDRYYDAEQTVVVTADTDARVAFELKGGKLVACGDLWLEPEAARQCLSELEEKQQAAAVGEFVQVPGGCFQMGDVFGGGGMDERPVHEVCLDPFAIGKFEVTQGQWQTVMGNNPSYFKKGETFPVEQVSWNAVRDFIIRLNEMTGKNFRLPTEAEWEYAARSGGKNELYSGGDNPADLAWYDANSGGATHAVGTKTPNGLGIYDMSGNVAEWVQDWYAGEYYNISPRRNPAGQQGDRSGRVYRGGGWNNGLRMVRTANRDRYEPTNSFAAIGFRLARSLQ